MSWDDRGPNWKATDIEKDNVGITDDEKLVADSERLLEKCSELNEQFKSMSENTGIQWAKKETFRKTVCDPAKQELTEINDKLTVRVEEIKVQAVEHELKTKKGLMSSVARFVLMGILINYGLSDNY